VAHSYYCLKLPDDDERGDAFSARLLFTFSGRAGKEMRRVEVQLTGWMIADAMAELRIWLDHYNCAPLNFEISRLPTGGIRVVVEFTDDVAAARTEREFGR
jgi:hypothetical protein